jgi:hypothetical protein
VYHAFGDDRGMPLLDHAPVHHDWPSYLREMCETLWPSPNVVSIEADASALRGAWHALRASWSASVAGAGHADGAEYLLIPGPRRLPLLVPPERRVGAAAVRHYSAARPSTRLVGKALSAALATGAGPAIFPGRVRVTRPAGADGIESYLQEALGRDIRVSVLLGPPRANRKPVLQILSPSGQAVGFAKIGVNPLTRDLVRSECASLAWLGRAGLDGITVPQVRHYGEWHGLTILVLDALPVWQRRPPANGPRLAAAMRVVAAVDGLWRGSLLSGPYLRPLRDRVLKTDDGPERAALLAVIDSLTDRMADRELTYGSWHGDWVPWNMATSGSGVLVWDWERFGGGVPVGFDALHHWLQTEVAHRRRDPERAAAGCAERASGLLAPFKIPAGEAHLVAVLYLADLAARNLIDRQEEAGARRGSPGTWLLPALAASAAAL